MKNNSDTLKGVLVAALCSIAASGVAENREHRSLLLRPVSALEAHRIISAREGRTPAPDNDTLPLAAPQVMAATDITPEGYTAHWQSVDCADGYLLYPRTIHVSDGIEPFRIVDTDFDGIAEGSLDNPLEPTYMVYSLDPYIDSPGWLVRLPLMARGMLGLTNRYLQSLGGSLLQSPTLNLSGAGGTVDVSLRYMARDVDMFQVCMYRVEADGNVSLRATKMVYTGEEFDIWKDSSFTLGGGTANSILVILLPETTGGTLWLDGLEVSQDLPEGSRYTVPGATIITENTWAYVSTAALPYESRSYSVKAYRIAGDTSIISQESNPITVGADSDEIPESLDVPICHTPLIDGSKFTLAWDTTAQANAYEVSVYHRHHSPGGERTKVIDENFDAIRVGTSDLDYPRAMHEDGYDNLDEFTAVPGWEVFQGFYVDGAVGILGYWSMLGAGCYMRSPKFDLSADDGNMTLSLSVGTDYYEQGATVYLAHDDPETGVTVYDDFLPLNEMSKGFHPFTTTFKNGRKDSYLVFFPYGYGMSYFDDILVTQRIPAGVSDRQVLRRVIRNATSATMAVPSVDTADSYYCRVRALWLDNSDSERVASPPSGEIPLPGLVPTTFFSGKVCNSEGNGIPAAKITLTTDTDMQSYSTLSNRWGLFRLENISDADAVYTATVSAPGYRTVVKSGIRFEALAPVTESVFTLPDTDPGSVEIGHPTVVAMQGPLYLRYNNSDTETLYSAEDLDLPVGSKILSVSYDGYCITDKEIECDISIRLANASADATYSQPLPQIDYSQTSFWSGHVSLNAIGSPDTPDRILHFSNDNGFVYNGAALRVGLQSRATRSSDFYFLVDGARQNQSILRYWARGNEGQWQVNDYGMPVMRITYTEPSGVILTKTVGTAPDIAAEGLRGAVSLTAHRNCTAVIHNVLGVAIATVHLREGETRTVSLNPGVYIIATNKILVK